MNKLRQFSGWDDLTGEAETTQIVRWVNELWAKKEAQARAHRRYNETNKALIRAAKELLDRGEIELLRKEAAK